MILKLIDKKVRQAFSNAALQYEALSGLQKEIGRELVSKTLDIEAADRILDVGMGTGRLTNRLSLYFPDSQVVGVDVASGMVQAAREKYETLNIVQADAKHLPFKAETFDIIVSNLAYHWVNDLPTALKCMSSLLRKDGHFIATVFGRRTLVELFEAIESTIQGGKAHKEISLSRLPTEEEVASSLRQAGFSNIKVSSEIIKTHFQDLYGLMKWVKDIGANAFEKDFFLGKDGLNKANQYYNEHYKDNWGVYASFEVIWIEAKTKT